MDGGESTLENMKEFSRLAGELGFEYNLVEGFWQKWTEQQLKELVEYSRQRRVGIILSFTRMLAGHADYTPMVFSERRGDTTWAHQISSAAIFTSPLLVFGAHPRNILQNPAVEIIKSIPSVWDETIVLPVSEIGEVAAFARRRGKVWFVAVMNGPTARTVDIPLSFLGAGKYQAVLVRDSAQEAAAVDIEDTVSTRSESIRIDLRAGGGFIGKFSL